MYSICEGFDMYGCEQWCGLRSKALLINHSFFLDEM